MTPQVDQMVGGTTSHLPRPEGNPAEMRKNAALIKSHADHLRIQEGRSAKETRISGSGPLVERVNQREEARTPVIQAQIKRLEDAAADLIRVAGDVEKAQSTWDTQQKARSKAPDAR